MPEQVVSKAEREIFRQSYLFFAHHCTPPINSDKCAQEWWKQFVQEMGEMDNAWKKDELEHELMVAQLNAIFTYIEKKAHVTARRSLRND